jgi:hypothetical protein
MDVCGEGRRASACYSQVSFFASAGVYHVWRECFAAMDMSSESPQLCFISLEQYLVLYATTKPSFLLV